MQINSAIYKALTYMHVIPAIVCVSDAEPRCQVYLQQLARPV